MASRGRGAAQMGTRPIADPRFSQIDGIRLKRGWSRPQRWHEAIYQVAKKPGISARLFVKSIVLRLAVVAELAKEMFHVLASSFAATKAEG